MRFPKVFLDLKFVYPMRRYWNFSSTRYAETKIFETIKNKQKIMFISLNFDWLKKNQWIKDWKLRTYLIFYFFEISWRIFSGQNFKKSSKSVIFNLLFVDFFSASQIRKYKHEFLHIFYYFKNFSLCVPCTRKMPISPHRVYEFKI
jgi:hypothetical protein